MIKDIQCFLLDMDGTIYLGNELIPGTIDFLETLRKQGKKYLFLTNNSSKNKKDYVEKLGRLGIKAKEDDIFTSGEATAIYLSKSLSPGSKLFVMGTPSLEEELSQAGYKVINSREQGIEDVDEVVLGFDTTMTYDKFWAACDIIREKKSYIATHPDFNCPLEGGKVKPDAGAMIAFIEASTRVIPKVIGKPNRDIIDAVCEKYFLEKSQLAMVGDRLYTDIKTGENAGIMSILVFSGETSIQRYLESDTQADLALDSIADLNEIISTL